MEQWISRSSPRAQFGVALACVIAGIVLMIAIRSGGPRSANATAAMLLGLLLLLIGLASYLTGGTQTVLVDPRTRRINIDDRTPLGNRKRIIPFDDVAEVSVGYLGKRSNYMMRYYLVLHLRNGEEYPLFAPGRFFEGGSSRHTVEQWHTRLEAYLRAR